MLKTCAVSVVVSDPRERRHRVIEARRYAEIRRLRGVVSNVIATGKRRDAGRSLGSVEDDFCGPDQERVPSRCVRPSTPNMQPRGGRTRQTEAEKRREEEASKENQHRRDWISVLADPCSPQTIE